jgi:hypothetical protein
LLKAGSLYSHPTLPRRLTPQPTRLDRSWPRPGVPGICLAFLKEWLVKYQYELAQQGDPTMSKRKAGHKLVTIEAPVEIVERLRALAIRNRRSMASEAIVAIERYIQAEEALPVAPPYGKTTQRRPT